MCLCAWGEGRESELEWGEGRGGEGWIEEGTRTVIKLTNLFFKNAVSIFYAFFLLYLLHVHMF